LGDIKGETGSTILAVQDQALIQTATRKKFWKKEKLKLNADHVKNTKKLLTA
jgi:hypothetical protein